MLLLEKLLKIRSIAAFGFMLSALALMIASGLLWTLATKPADNSVALAATLLDLRQATLRYNSDVGSWPTSLRQLGAVGYLPANWNDQLPNPGLGLLQDLGGHFYITLDISAEKWLKLEPLLDHASFHEQSEQGRLRVMQTKSDLFTPKQRTDSEPVKELSSQPQASGDKAMIRSNLNQIATPDRVQDPVIINKKRR